MAVTGYRDDVDPNQGDFGPGVPTNDTSPLLQGTVSGLQGGDIVLIYQNGVLLGPAAVNAGTGTWTYQINGLLEGSYTYTAIIADTAGNLGTTSAPFERVVDLTPPTVGNSVAITAYIDDEPPQVGEFPSATPTNDT
mgnify:CR=1 FL=1